MKGTEIANITQDLIFLGKLEEALLFLREYDLLEFNKEVRQLGFRLRFLRSEREKISDLSLYLTEMNKISLAILNLAEVISWFIMSILIIFKRDLSK